MTRNLEGLDRPKKRIRTNESVPSRGWSDGAKIDGPTVDPRSGKSLLAPACAPDSVSSGYSTTREISCEPTPGFRSPAAPMTFAEAQGFPRDCGRAAQRPSRIHSSRRPPLCSGVHQVDAGLSLIEHSLGKGMISRLWRSATEKKAHTVMAITLRRWG